jgi:MoxR-like ATPase
MAERQVTIADESFKLDQPFLVMATQNPVEQEGTYQLPEAHESSQTAVEYPLYPLYLPLAQPAQNH